MPLEPDASERAPTAAETIRRALNAYGMDLRVSMQAVVTAFDGKNKVSVKPLVKNAYLDENDTRQVESFPIITGVPVQFPGSGVFRLSFPISDGTLVVGGVQVPATTGTLVFSDRSLDKWLTGKGGEVDPEIDHEHALSDAVFFAGVTAFGVAVSAPTDAICLGDLNGNDFVALASIVDDLNSKLRAAITAAKTAVVAQDGGLAAFTAFDAALKPPVITYTWPKSVAASQVKAK